MGVNKVIWVLVVFSLVLITTYACARTKNTERSIPWELEKLFTQEEYDFFISAVKDYFKEQGKEVSIHTGVLDIKDGDQKLGLVNLAQQCHLGDRSEWPSIIAAHFSAMPRIQKEHALLEERQKDFDQVKHSLAVRILDEDYAKAHGDLGNMIYRIDFEGTVSVVAYDLEESVGYVPKETAQGWNKNEEELFKIGLENIKNKYTLEVTPIPFDNGETVYILLDNSSFAITHSLLLEEYPLYIGTKGTLIGIPRKDTLLFYPIQDEKVMTVLGGFIKSINELNKQGPVSTSTKLYWKYNNKFTTLNYYIDEDNNKLTFDPPQSFLDVFK